MVAINFYEKFKPAIQRGDKTRTIRPHKMKPARCKVGDKLQLYINQRLPTCEKIADAICVGVAFVVIMDNGDVSLQQVQGVVDICSKDKDFFQLDGFNNKEEFFDFFKKQSVVNHLGWWSFSGWMYLWELDGAEGR